MSIATLANVNETFTLATEPAFVLRPKHTHLTLTGYEAGRPLCDCDKADCSAKGDMFTHAAYAPAELLRGESNPYYMPVCPTCLALWNDDSEDEVAEVAPVAKPVVARASAKETPEAAHVRSIRDKERRAVKAGRASRLADRPEVAPICGGAPVAELAEVEPITPPSGFSGGEAETPPARVFGAKNSNHVETIVRDAKGRELIHSGRTWLVYSEGGRYFADTTIDGNGPTFSSPLRQQAIDFALASDRAKLEWMREAEYDLSEATDAILDGSKDNGAVWFGWSDEQREGFDAWLGWIGSPILTQDGISGRNDGLFRWDEFVHCLANGSPLPAVEPSEPDPGPDGQPEDADATSEASDALPATPSRIGVDRFVSRFPGGFELIGAEPAEPTMIVKGQLYRVSVEAEGIILTKSDGTSHVIIDGCCSCPSAHFANPECKHLAGLRSSGLLPPLPIFPDTPSVDFPEATMQERCPNCEEWINADNDLVLCKNCGKECCEDCLEWSWCYDCNHGAMEGLDDCDEARTAPEATRHRTAPTTDELLALAAFGWALPGISGGAPEADKTCPDCGAHPGELHDHGCDVERCPNCGRQLISCNCPGEDYDPRDDTSTFVAGLARMAWTGEWPGDVECREYGVDLNTLVTTCRWDRARRRWVKPEPIRASGQEPDPDTLLDEPEPARNCPYCGSGPLSRNLATDWLTCLACGKRSWPSGRPHVEDEARPDSLLDDLEHSARSLSGPRATRTEDELALTMREAAEEIRTLRTLVARREAEATTYWDALDDTKGLREACSVALEAILAHNQIAHNGMSDGHLWEAVRQLREATGAPNDPPYA